MGTQRSAREAKALAFLRQRGPASAAQIGAAALAGEPWAARRNASSAKAEIGLSIAISLAKAGMVKVTTNNWFTTTTPGR